MPKPGPDQDEPPIRPIGWDPAAGRADDPTAVVGGAPPASAVPPLEDPVFSTMSLDGTPAPAEVERPSSVVGPYKLLQQIGEGGMGVVFLAGQTEPIRRNVALKIIKPGMDSRQVIARFEAERQALAMMDHPNIARVLDAGTTATGRPYFVMELVKGLPITEYCDQARLTPRERLELLIPVCQAVQHAHQKGIIHRDIKPSNVLVSLYDGRPVPKVIDFGVAKAMDQPLTERTLFTRHGAIVGTLEYMSPEQAENSALDVDTRTDIYALGVILYELLTGTTPLGRLRDRPAGYSEIVRRLREEETPRLSTRISRLDQLAAIAARRSMEPAKLARLVRGDLDWIAMKALEKDRNRRYSTANDLARDLARYLAGEPVEAGPPSTVYRMRKYARKHRAALVTASAFVAVLVAATLVSIGLAVRATREATRAARAESQARATFGFFRHKVLAAARPKGRDGGLGREVTIRAALDKAEPAIAADLAGQPKVEADIRDVLGTTYFHLGDADAAARQLERAVELRTADLGPDDDETLDSEDTLGVAYQQQGRLKDAIALHARVYEASRSRRGPDHPATLSFLSNLATSYRLDGQVDRAIPMFERVLAVRRATLGLDHRDTLVATNNVAVAYRAAGRPAEALPLWEQTLERSRTSLGPEDPDTLIVANNLASAYVMDRRAGDAATLFEGILRLRRRDLDPDHPDTLVSMNNLATTYLQMGRVGDAIPLFEKVLAARRAKLAPGHPDTLKSLNALALAYWDVGRIGEAIPLLQQALAGQRERLGPDHAETILAIGYLGAAYLDQKRFAEAEPVLRQCLELRDRKETDGWRRFQTMSLLGAALAGQSKYARAEPLLIDGYEGLSAREPKIPTRLKREVTAAAARIAPFYEAWGRPDKAAEWRARTSPPSGSKVHR